MNPSLKKIIVVGVVAAVFISIAGAGLNKWVEGKMQKVALGLAESSFPYRDYTVQELAKMYPQIKYADVPTRVTPEETYAKFRQALKENNLEMAIEQLGRESKKYGENVEKLQKAYKENKFLSNIKLYPEKTWRSTFGESIGNLCYEQERDNGKFVGCTDFIKDANGDWKLDSL